MRADASTWLSVRLWDALDPARPQRGADLATALGEPLLPTLAALAHMTRAGTARRHARGVYLRDGLRPDHILRRQIVHSDESLARISEARRLRGQASHLVLRERILRMLLADVDTPRHALADSLGCSRSTVEEVLREMRDAGLVVSSRRGYRLAPPRV